MCRKRVSVAAAGADHSAGWGREAAVCVSAAGNSESGAVAVSHLSDGLYRYTHIHTHTHTHTHTYILSLSLSLTGSTCTHKHFSCYI